MLEKTKVAMRKVETLSGGYILLGSFLFKWLTEPEEESAVLMVSDSCAYVIITLSWKSVLRIVSITKTYLNISDRLFISSMI